MAGVSPAVELRLVVSRKVAADRFQPVAATHLQPDAAMRNMKKVKNAVTGITEEEGQVIVLEVDHGEQ